MKICAIRVQGFPILAKSCPQPTLDFLTKPVIINTGLSLAKSIRKAMCYFGLVFLTMFDLCEDLRVPEREVFIDVFKAATVQKTSIQRKNAKNAPPELSWHLAIGY
jgi:hypothetical protein